MTVCVHHLEHYVHYCWIKIADILVLSFSVFFWIGSSLPLILSRTLVYKLFTVSFFFSVVSPAITMDDCDSLLHLLQSKTNNTDFNVCSCGLPLCCRNQLLLSSRLVVSDSLWPHEPQHARPPCPSPSPGVHSNSCPLSRWCHPAISSSVAPFSSCPQSFPASGSFLINQLFASAYDYFKHLKILDNIQTKAFQVEISTAEQWRREVARPVHGWLTCPWRNVPSVGQGGGTPRPLVYPDLRRQRSDLGAHGDRII